MYKKSVFHSILLCCMLFFLQGCLNVNIKSILPEQAYYNLDNTVLQSDCKNLQTSYGINVSVLSPFDGKDILLYNPKQEIVVLESHKWIDLPKNMIRNAFIKIGLNHCIQIEQNPPISQRVNTLRLNINEMYVAQNENEYKAYISLTYEILSYDMKRIKNSIIISHANDQNPAIALQKALQDSLHKIIADLAKK